MINLADENNQSSEKKIQNNNCFVITPIGAQDGRERRFADGITKEVIEPVLKEFDMTPIVAHRISETGSINDQVIQHIYKDKLAICNLTGLNPNVMYELGVRYTMRKHTILICEQGTRLPFDIITERTIFYTNDIAGSAELKEQLKDMISTIDYSSEPENPIFKVLDFDKAMGNVKDEGAADALIEKMKDVLENHSTKNVTKSNVYAAVIEKLDNIPFSATDWNSLVSLTLTNSNQQVYFTSSVVSNSQKVWVVYFHSKVPVDVGFNYIVNAVNKLFSGIANVMLVDTPNPE